MELRQLRYFTAVLEKSSVSAAAKALFMSQPPLSAQIQALERELGVALFDRTGRQMRPTEAGRILYARAKDILDVCSSVKSEMEDLRTGAAGVMRLGVVSSICGSFLFQWMKEFCSSRPGVRLELCEADTYRLLEMARNRQVELAFVRTPFAASELSVVPLRREPLCAVGLPGFFSGSGKEAVSLQELAGRPLLLYRRWEQILISVFQKEGLVPEIFCMGDDSRTILSLAGAGFGIGIVPLSIFGETGGPLLCRPILHPELISDICAVYRKDTYMPRITRLFLEDIRRRAPECPRDTA